MLYMMTLCGKHTFRAATWTLFTLAAAIKYLVLRGGRERGMCVCALHQIMIVWTQSMPVEFISDIHTYPSTLCFISPLIIRLKYIITLTRDAGAVDSEKPDGSSMLQQWAVCLISHLTLNLSIVYTHKISAFHWAGLPSLRVMLCGWLWKCHCNCSGSLDGWCEAGTQHLK